MFTVLRSRETATESVGLRWDERRPEQINLILLDKESGDSFCFDVPPDKANDAFEHPFIYALPPLQREAALV